MPDTNSRIGITVLGSGSRGNSTVIHAGNEAIIVDAGFSARETKKRLEMAGLSGIRVKAILVTHEHDDHVKGLRVCSNALDAPVFATMKCAQHLRAKDTKLHQMGTFAAGGSFEIGCFRICPFTIPHDACDPVGFTFMSGNTKLAVATDIGFVSSIVQYQLRDCNALVLESNHDLNMLAASDRPWNLKQRIMGRHGHLSNVDSMQLLGSVMARHTRNVILAHLSSECNRVDIARGTAEQCLKALNRQDVTLDVAIQDGPLPTVWCS